ncbi:cation transporter [Micromonospora sp. NPDC005806]|uniref:cation transporter n=1 Tax=Micromonospora sp. NPDC005806 TaxID=3364234 RepID=UPI003673DDC7
MARSTVTYTLTVQGMHCASCGMLIDETVEKVDGVVSSTTSVRTGMAKVAVDPGRCSPADVVAAIGDAGYTARLERP